MCIYLHIPTTMTFRIFMDVHYYLMDDFFSLYYSWYLEWLFLHMLLAKSSFQMAYDRALLWTSMANPFLWMTTARCAMCKCGSRDFKWLRIGTRQNVSCV